MTGRILVGPDNQGCASGGAESEAASRVHLSVLVGQLLTIYFVTFFFVHVVCAGYVDARNGYVN